MVGRRRPRTEKPPAKEATAVADPSLDCTKTGALVLTERVWNRLRHNGRLVRDEVTGHLPPVLRPAAWREFQQMPLARCACWLMSRLEPQQSAPPGLYQRRRRRPAGAGLFDDIPQLAQRDRAKEIYANLCSRHADRLASCPWLRPVLAGRARWIATHPGARDSEWGKRMRRQKGGKQAQRRYREDGWHPLRSVRESWGSSAEKPPA